MRKSQAVPTWKPRTAFALAVILCFPAFDTMRGVYLFLFTLMAQPVTQGPRLTAAQTFSSQCSCHSDTSGK